MDRIGARVLLADMYYGLSQAKHTSRHDMHTFLTRVPMSEADMALAYLKSQHTGGDYEHKRGPMGGV